MRAIKKTVPAKPIVLGLIANRWKGAPRAHSRIYLSIYYYNHLLDFVKSFFLYSWKDLYESISNSSKTLELLEKWKGTAFDIGHII